MLEFLLGGGVGLLGVICGGAVVICTNWSERRNDRLDTPAEKANREAYRRKRDDFGEPVSEDAGTAVAVQPTRTAPVPTSVPRWAPTTR